MKVNSPDPVVEKAARKLLGIEGVPPKEQARMIRRSLLVVADGVSRLRAELHRADVALSESPFHGQEELAEASLADGIRNYRNAVEAELARLRAEVEMLVWNLAGISTLACSRTPTDYNREVARPALNEVAELVKDYTHLRAVNAELEKAMARMTGEICRADNALAESGPNYVSGASLADGIRVLTMDNAKFRELLGLALSDSKCGAEDDFFTVATECTEGKCWHIKARAALSSAEQAEPEVKK